MDTEFVPRSLGTHDGTFHADEVTACALLILFDLVDRGKIYRTRDPSILSKCEFVCDVGGVYDPKIKRFDHHQLEYHGELSSAGMVLLYLKRQNVINEEVYKFFNRSLVLGVDAHDNGKVTSESGHCSFSGVVSNFVPVFHDSPATEVEKAFFSAVDFALGHVMRLLKRYTYIRECKKEVAAAMKQGQQFLYFSKSVPWLDAFFDLGGESHPALFLVMPTGKHWKLRGIPPNFRDRMKVRVPLPREWAGLLDKELEKVAGIKGAIFCHKGRFISVWETKEAAMSALERILSKERLR